MQEQWQIARDIAARKSVEFTRLAEETVKASERTSYRTLAGQYAKAAAELDKGNHPRYCSEGWLVESRSTFVGRVVSIEIAPRPDTGEIVEIPLDEMKLKLLVTGGDVYLYDPLLHKCQCAAFDSGCWHSCMSESWILAAELVTIPEEYMPDWEEMND